MAKKTSKKPARKSPKASKPKAKRPAAALASKATRKAVTKRKPAAPAKKATRPSDKAATGPSRKAALRIRPKLALPAVVDAVDSEPEVVAPVEPPLTPAEVEEFRELLTQKRSQLIKDMGSLQDEALNKNRRDAAGDLSSMPIHMADLGSDNYEMEFTLGLIESERTVLREIEDALERIKRGTYGVCQGTGRPIGKARLRAKPWAKFSYEYTLALETGQARRY